MCRAIAGLYGADIFRRLSHEYGGNWLPGAMNRALRRITGGKKSGRTFDDLYPGFRASMEERKRHKSGRMARLRGEVEKVST